MLQHRFVEFMPETLEDGILYISMEYSTAIHKCACGCGNKVVTPIAPTSWHLEFDGKSISLSPSIGNWSFDCKSHYWIEKNKIKWAGKWSKSEIQYGRKRDVKLKLEYYDKAEELSNKEPELQVIKLKSKAWNWKSLFSFLGVK